MTIPNASSCTHLLRVTPSFSLLYRFVVARSVTRAPGRARRFPLESQFEFSAASWSLAQSRRFPARRRDITSKLDVCNNARRPAPSCARHDMSQDKDSSFSNPEEVKSEHLHLKLSIDFNFTIITGSVEFSILASKGARSFVLDTKDLAISGVTVDGKESAYSLAAKHEIFGSALSIPLPPNITAAGGRCSVIVNYSTSPKSSACQWLPPAQTAGKRFPFLFTQCQAIHARSLLPCQDCPKAKCTWSSEITAPSFATVLMSALQEGSPGIPAPFGTHSSTEDIFPCCSSAQWLRARAGSSSGGSLCLHAHTSSPSPSATSRPATSAPAARFPSLLAPHPPQNVAWPSSLLAAPARAAPRP